MGRRHRLLIAGCALAAGVAAAGCVGSSSAPRHGEQRYRGDAPPLALSFVYPADWRLTTETGARERYVQLRLLGPRNAEGTYTAYITVRGVPPDAEGGAMESLDEWVTRYTNQLLEGAAVESIETGQLQDAETRDLVVSFTVPPLFRSGLKPLPIPVKTRTVFLQHGSSRYACSYSADAREYAAHVQVFDWVLASLRFQ